MKRLLVLLALTCFIGCYSFSPVSSMSDSLLRQEYLNNQYQIKTLESVLLTGTNYMPVSQQQAPTSYTTTGSANTYGNTTYVRTQTTPNYRSSSAANFANGYNMGSTIKINRKRKKLERLLSRQRALGMEMHKRGIMSP